MLLQTKFRELERILLHEAHLLSVHSGVPFLLLVYPPNEERFCRQLQAELMEKLRAKGKPVIEHRLDTFIFEYYANKLKDKGGLAKLFDLERTAEDDLRRMIANVYENTLVKNILQTVNRADPNGAIFLTGVGAMYPFGRVSNLLTTLENKIKIPLVVFYPGDEKDGQLRFLMLEEHTGYRAKVI